MRSTIGKNIRVSIWGGSHEPAIGVDIDGIPEGTLIDMTQLEAFLKRRAPGNSPFATKRKEPDTPVPVRGLKAADSGGKAGNMLTTDGGTVSLEIKNTDTRSGDYKALRSVPRPGHADYTARLRYGDTLNMSGGGPFSARMTAPLCIAGGIALQMLAARGITIGAHIYSIAGINDIPFDPLNTDPALLSELKKAQAGDTVNITLFRAGAEVEVTVVLDEKPSQEELDAMVQEQEQQNQEEYYYQYPFGFGN